MDNHLTLLKYAALVQGYILQAGSYAVANPLDIALGLVLFVVGGFAHLELLFLFYLAGMNLEYVSKTRGLTQHVKVLSFPLTLLGPLVNLTFTAFWGMILFFDPPREAAFSLRLGRYCSDPAYAGTWRRKLALWFAHNVINPHDFYGGNHIKGS